MLNVCLYLFLPRVNVQSGGGLIREGADNVDINIETMDGKTTFHSLAKVVFLATTC